MADYMGSGNSADKPEWMREPSLKDIPVDKLDFLQKMVFESKTLLPEGADAFSHGSRPRSRSANITFTQEEMTVIIEAIKIQHPRGTDENESDIGSVQRRK